MGNSTANAEPLFIVGCKRSGTTMLRLMLNEHPDIHIPNESWFLPDLWEKLPSAEPLSKSQLDTAFSTITSKWRWQFWDMSDDELFATLSSLNHPNLAKLIDAVYAYSAQRAGKRRWGDKTPIYVRHIDQIHRIFPSAKFIHIIRDGRDVCLSMSRLDWRHQSVWHLARYWSKEVESGIRAGRKLGSNRYYEVSYEDLVLDGEGVLRKICDFLDIDFDNAMLRFYERAPDNIASWAVDTELHQKTFRKPASSDVYRWKREMSPYRRYIFESIAGSTMDRVGQQRKAHGPLTRIVRIGTMPLEWIVLFPGKFKRLLRRAFRT